jgi:hypothetical protein
MRREVSRLNSAKPPHNRELFELSPDARVPYTLAFVPTRRTLLGGRSNPPRGGLKAGRITFNRTCRLAELNSHCLPIGSSAVMKPHREGKFLAYRLAMEKYGR